MISLVSLLQTILVLATLNLNLTFAAPIAQDSTSAFADLEDRDVSYMQSRLFPLGGYPSKSAWTTSTALSDRFNLQAGIPINKGGKPPQGHAPDGKGAIVSFFPQGSINPGNKQAPKGGMSWYTSGPHWGSTFTKGTGSWEDDLTRAKEITFGYSVMFENGFQFNKGGKLPGVYGGVSEEEAVGCSGGRQEGRDGCFSSRLMWRTDGAGETYNYLPTSAHQPESYCQTAPESHCNPDYGDSIGRGSFYFTPGQWVTVAQHIKLNDIGSSNGAIEIFVDGVSKLNVQGIELRTRGDSVFRGIQAQTFFGGHSTDWASPKDQTAWFKDWSLAIIN
ncbi:hypothetical protein FFLO_04597 [Filobasidium floriforme]|uniref:Polysaccharide lyase 14 domain-containing protein n=1 Tax=Filobasidium floriforme TaxID=5210 RepID=A0A8K0NM70_9TREE|nr:hypothetical protein FFLO_04597 [Filobasidium floriforme]